MLSDWSRAVRTARAWADLTQAELGKAVGVDTSSVSLWESGDREPRLSRMEAIAAACGVEPAVLLRWAMGVP